MLLQCSSWASTHTCHRFGDANEEDAFMPWASLMWQQWTEGLLGISPPLGCRESRDLAAAVQLWKICSWTAKTQKDKLQTNPQHLTFQEVQFSTGTLQLILHNPFCSLPFKENIFVVALQSTWKKRNEILFSYFLSLHWQKEQCHYFHCYHTEIH